MFELKRSQRKQQRKQTTNGTKENKRQDNIFNPNHIISTLNVNNISTLRKGRGNKTGSKAKPNSILPTKISTLSIKK